MEQKQIARVIDRLEQNNMALERIAYLYDKSTLKDLEEGIIESSSESKTCLIEIRNNNILIEELKNNKGD